MSKAIIFGGSPQGYNNVKHLGILSQQIFLFTKMPVHNWLLSLTERNEPTNQTNNGQTVNE